MAGAEAEEVPLPYGSEVAALAATMKRRAKGSSPPGSPLLSPNAERREVAWRSQRTDGAGGVQMKIGVKRVDQATFARAHGLTVETTRPSPSRFPSTVKVEEVFSEEDDEEEDAEEKKDDR